MALTRITHDVMQQWRTHPTPILLSTLERADAKIKDITTHFSHETQFIYADHARIWLYDSAPVPFAHLDQYLAQLYRATREGYAARAIWNEEPNDVTIRDMVRMLDRRFEDCALVVTEPLERVAVVNYAAALDVAQNIQRRRSVVDQ